MLSLRRQHQRQEWLTKPGGGTNDKTAHRGAIPKPQVPVLLSNSKQQTGLAAERRGRQRNVNVAWGSVH